jgi:hypothetical protein
VLLSRRKSLDCASAPARLSAASFYSEQWVTSNAIFGSSPPRTSQNSSRAYLARTSEWVTACTESMMRF